MGFFKEVTRFVNDVGDEFDRMTGKRAMENAMKREQEQMAREEKRMEKERAKREADKKNKSAKRKAELDRDVRRSKQAGAKKGRQATILAGNQSGNQLGTNGSDGSDGKYKSLLGT